MGGHKRKRQEEEAAPEEPTPKKQATEKQTNESAAERRQKRSERKAKKAHESKQNASRTTPKNKAKYEPKNGEKKKAKRTKSNAPTTTAPELVQATTSEAAVDDTLASGQDFVSLTEPAAEVKPAGKKAKASKTKPVEQNGTQPTSTKDEQPSSATRFIAFVGNLPYSTTTAQITSHFRKLTPTSIRHPTDKQTGKSKGYAFLEFDNYSSMKTCLKVYHHSMFDPERTSKLPDDAFDENGIEIVAPGQQQERKGGSGRRINVELTAGGGGKGEGRKEKIRVKNTRLEEQRDRRREADIKADKARKRKSGISDVNQVEVKVEDTRGDIHPSRLKRVKA